jgi:hypothetical protein
MCYILCTSSSVYVAPVCIGVEGGGGKAPREFFFLGKHVTFLPRFLCCLDFCVHCWAVFRHMVFADGFLFPG